MNTNEIKELPNGSYEMELEPFSGGVVRHRFDVSNRPDGRLVLRFIGPAKMKCLYNPEDKVNKPDDN